MNTNCLKSAFTKSEKVLKVFLSKESAIINEVQHMFWEPGNDHIPSATLTVIHAVITVAPPVYSQALLNHGCSATLRRIGWITELRVRQGRERLGSWLSFQPLSVSPMGKLLSIHFLFSLLFSCIK